MSRFLLRVWREEQGTLTFEWILVITVLVIGIVGGLSTARDALISELGDVTEGMISLDQSYTAIAPWSVQVPDCEADGASSSSFTDAAGVGERRKPYSIRRNQSNVKLDCPPDVELPP